MDSDWKEFRKPLWLQIMRPKAKQHPTMKSGILKYSLADGEGRGGGGGRAERRMGDLINYLASQVLVTIYPFSEFVVLISAITKTVSSQSLMEKFSWTLW